jgi:hypothetical protein
MVKAVARQLSKLKSFEARTLPMVYVFDFLHFHKRRAFKCSVM